MFLDKLFHTIGAFIESLFKSTKKAWLKLSQELRDAMTKASSIVNVINTNLEATPDFVWKLIQTKFPDITEDKAKEIIAAAVKGLEIESQIQNDDLLTMIQNLQAYLATLNGGLWEKRSHTLYLGISAFLAPAGSKLGAFVVFAEYVYHDLIKGK